MDDFTKAMGMALIAAGALFILPILGTLFGALGGWIVGLFFDDTIRDTLARFGVRTNGLAIWQLGAVAGFVGGYFRTRVSKSK